MMYNKIVKKVAHLAGRKEGRMLKKRGLLLGWVITGAVLMAIFLGIFYAAGMDVTDDSWWVQSLFAISGIMGLGLLISGLIAAHRFSKNRR